MQSAIAEKHTLEQGTNQPCTQSLEKVNLDNSKSTVHSGIFIPKLCLILKNLFLVRWSSNFQERLLMPSSMPQFIFGVSIFSLKGNLTQK